MPVLWDKERRTIVNNESAEIIRMLNGAFGRFTNVRTDYYPQALRAEIDRVNDLVYGNVNNGVYRAGFATSQEAYEEASARSSPRSTRSSSGWRASATSSGADITEADWRLFTTLVRFDAVYYSHFKCNLRRIIDYPNLSNYLRDLYQQAGVAATVNMDHIKRHYYGSQRHVNPTGIVPIGPELDFSAPHDRARFGHRLMRAGPDFVRLLGAPAHDDEPLRADCRGDAIGAGGHCRELRSLSRTPSRAPPIRSDRRRDRERPGGVELRPRRPASLDAVALVLDFGVCRWQSTPARCQRHRS